MPNSKFIDTFVTMLISVIVPVYQSERFIKRCVDSILAQDYKDIELLLIDDGSTDNSGDICQQYADSNYRIRVFHGPNSGLSAARNKGIEMATGKWITFIDSDDAITPETFSSNARILEEHPDIDILEYPILEHAGSSREHMLSFNPEREVTGADVLKDWIQTEGYRHCYACNKFFSARIFKEKGLKFPVGESFEDIALYTEAIQACRSVYYSNRGCYIYYLNKEGITNNYTYLNIEPLLRHNFHLHNMIVQMGKKSGTLHDWIKVAQCKLWAGCLNLTVDWYRIRTKQKTDVNKTFMEILKNGKPSCRSFYKCSLGAKMNFKYFIINLFGVEFGVKAIAGFSKKL